MRLVIVTNLFPTPVDPERGVFTLQLAKAMQDFAEIEVICPLPWFPKWRVLKSLKQWYGFSQIPSEYTMEGIKVYSPKYLMLPNISERYHARLMQQVVYRQMKKMHEQKPIEAINSQWFYPDSVATEQAAKKLGIPHIATGLGCDINRDMQHPVKRKLVLDMLRSAQGSTVVSEDLKRVLVEYGADGSRITSILNGVNVDQFKIKEREECRQQLGLSLSEKFILYVGRLSEEKNVLGLVNAFSQMKDNSWQLKLVGDGPERSSIKQRIEQLNIDSRVHMVGKVDHHLVAVWMGACNLFCLPSFNEGCPNVVLEALGSGRPVIASKVGAIPDLISDAKRNGLLFEPEDIFDINQKLSAATEQHWNEQAIAETVSELSWEHAAERYVEVLRQAKRDPISNEGSRRAVS